MKEIEGSRKFKSPIEDLILEAKEFLETMIISQKPKDKLAITENKEGKKQLKIRAALHQETYYGKTNNRDTKTINISLLQTKDIGQIIDKNLQDEIDVHRKKYDTMKEAFSGEGLVAFNDSRLQNNKPPVYKVKVWYSKKESEEQTLSPLSSNSWIPHRTDGPPVYAGSRTTSFSKIMRVPSRSSCSRCHTRLAKSFASCSVWNNLLYEVTFVSFGSSGRRITMKCVMVVSFG